MYATQTSKEQLRVAVKQTFKGLGGDQSGHEREPLTPCPPPQKEKHEIRGRIMCCYVMYKWEKASH